MKAISPIIATILIVIITVSLAVFLWTYFTSYISSKASEIPELCMNTIELKCAYNETHITSCLLKHQVGIKTYNTSINIVCLEDGKNNTIDIGTINVGITIPIKADFRCNKNDIIISVSGICEGLKTSQIFYECKGIRCLYS